MWDVERAVADFVFEGMVLSSEKGASDETTNYSLRVLEFK
jgi:hypothetical protein